MPQPQDLIYHLEEGKGKLWLKITVAALAFIVVILAYNWFCFRNMGTQEAMDCAQLARNISEGKGFTTLFVRPFSLHLIQQRAARNPQLSAPWESADPAGLKGMHPDIANAPLYPLVLAALMKVLPFDYQVDVTHRFWSMASESSTGDSEQSLQPRIFRRYQPDFIIAAFNQVLLLALAAFSFFFARQLFDTRTALMSTVLLLGTNLLWRFAVSGLSTILLLLIFMGLIWSLNRLIKGHDRPKRIVLRGASEAASRLGRDLSAQEKPAGPTAALCFAGLAGGLVAVGALTRYSVGWLILPVLMFIIVFMDHRRLVLCAVALITFLVILAPWLARNYLVSGSLFGTASYSVLEGTRVFPGHSLQRLLDSNVTLARLDFLKLAWSKILSNGRELAQNDVPKIGGTWVGGFFLAGVMEAMADKRIRPLAVFTTLSCVALAIAQALSRTQLSIDSPEVNSENLLILLVPVVWIFGASLFYRLLDQVRWPLLEARSLAIGTFGIITCLPMILDLLAAPRSPLVFPPYYPPDIQKAAAFVNRDELMMSDIPWAAAWYGRCQSVWLTRTKRDFFAINDRLKPVGALFLSHAACTGPFQSFDDWIRAGDESWGDFILDCVLNKRQGKAGPPSDFPLEYWQKGWPAYFLLTSREKPLSDAR